MKIEAGKLYKTRGGRKARIYAVDCGSDDQWAHGAIQRSDDEWDGGVSWSKNGNMWVDRTDDDDLIDYWPTEEKYGMPTIEELNEKTSSLSSAAALQLLTDLSQQLGLYNEDGLDSHPLYRDRPTKWENQ